MARPPGAEARAGAAVVVRAADREDVAVEIERVALHVRRLRAASQRAVTRLGGDAEDVPAGARLQARRRLAVPADRVHGVRLDGPRLPVPDDDFVGYPDELD